MMVSESIIHEELVLKDYQSRKYQRTINQITVSTGMSWDQQLSSIGLNIFYWHPNK